MSMTLFSFIVCVHILCHEMRGGIDMDQQRRIGGVIALIPDYRRPTRESAGVRIRGDDSVAAFQESGDAGQVGQAAA